MDAVNLMPQICRFDFNINSQGTRQADERGDMVAAAMINVTERLPAKRRRYAVG